MEVTFVNGNVITEFLGTFMNDVKNLIFFFKK